MGIFIFILSKGFCCRTFMDSVRFLCYLIFISGVYMVVYFFNMFVGAGGGGDLAISIINLFRLKSSYRVHKNRARILASIAL